MLFKKSNAESEEAHDSERWLLSYADFITLLFALFVVLYATSQADQDKAKEFEDSIRKTLSGMSTGGLTPQPVTGTVRSPVENHLNRRGRTNPETVKAQRYIEHYIESNFTSSEIDNIFGELTDDVLGVRISVATKSLFVGSSIQLSKDGKRILKQLGKVFLNTGRNLWIEGHTAEQGGVQPASHWRLSAMIASTVTSYFASDLGFPSARLTTVSHANKRPIFSGKNKYKNQRIDFLILTDLSPI